MTLEEQDKIYPIPEQENQIRTDHWVKSNHYHCHTCGAEVQFLTRLAWRTSDGVNGIGICRNCRLIMIECETLAAPKWIQIQ